MTAINNNTYDMNHCQLASVGLDSTNKTEYSWHQGRLTNVSFAPSAPFGGQFSYSYLPGSDLLETTTYLGGTATVTRAYDAANRLTSISTINHEPSTINHFSYSYDSTGRRIRCDLSDSSCVSYAYDQYDQLISASKTNSPNSATDAAYNYAYQYDEVGNRLHQDRGKQDLDGTFNPLNQLTHLKFGGKLDVVGNVTGTNATDSVKVDGEPATIYNNTNFLGGASLNTGSNAISIVAWQGTNATEEVHTVYAPPTNPEQFSYDANGNLTSDGFRNFTWNNENRLIAITPILPDTHTPKLVFTYDGQGRRVQRTDYSSWNGLAYTQTNTTRFVWDGWLLLAELTADNVISNYYISGLDLSQSLQGAGGVGGLLASFKCQVSSNQTYLYTYDGNGNVVDVLDDTASVVAHYEYDPYGRIVAQSGTFASENPFRFSTKYFEPDWNLYYYGYRYYSPSLGRWLSRDPIGEDGGINLYAAFDNTPINISDYLGLWCITTSEIESTTDCEKAGSLMKITAGASFDGVICTCTCELWEILQEYCETVQLIKFHEHCEFDDPCSEHPIIFDQYWEETYVTGEFRETGRNIVDQWDGGQWIDSGINTCGISCGRACGI